MSIIIDQNSENAFKGLAEKTHFSKRPDTENWFVFIADPAYAEKINLEYIPDKKAHTANALHIEISDEIRYTRVLKRIPYDALKENKTLYYSAEIKGQNKGNSSAEIEFIAILSTAGNEKKSLEFFSHRSRVIKVSDDWGQVMGEFPINHGELSSKKDYYLCIQLAGVPVDLSFSEVLLSSEPVKLHGSVIAEEVVNGPGYVTLDQKCALPKEAAYNVKQSPISPELSYDMEVVDIVICVYNALEDVKTCLSSIQKIATCPYRLILVNDGSEKETVDFLYKFSEENAANTLLIDLKKNHGYTVALNRGIQASKSDKVFILNSDTIVSLGWIENILEVFETHPESGIVGALSNAASYQSVPSVHNAERTDWNTDPVLPDHHLTSEIVRSFKGATAPRMTTINGFCYAVKREVFDAIGYYDEGKYKTGYSEENDFCLRAEDAGFENRVCTKAYVFHAKSKSFSHEKRKELSKKNGGEYKLSYGKSRLSCNASHMEKYNGVDALRRHIAHALSFPDASICYILPCSGLAGGSISVLQLVKALRDLGVKAYLVYPEKSVKDIAHLELDDAIIPYRKTEEIPYLLSSFNVLVATHYTSVEYVRKAMEMGSRVLQIPAYFIQDYEVWFREEGTAEYDEAYRSYEVIPHNLGIVKTTWLKKVVEDAHGSRIKVFVSPPGFDTKTYAPHIDNLIKDTPFAVAGMIRPHTPRRQPAMTAELLEIVSHYPNVAKSSSFGCDIEEIPELGVETPNVFNLGKLSQQSMEYLLRNSDVFVDLSTFQAFGRTGLEAMAAGCVPILPKGSGCHLYARHEENAILTDTTSMEEALHYIKLLSEDKAMLRKLQFNGIQTARQFTLAEEAITHASLLTSEWQVQYSQPKVSILSVVNEGEESAFFKMLSSLKNSTDYSNMELVVLLNGVNFNVKSIKSSLASLKIENQLITPNKVSSYAQAINDASKVADGEYFYIASDAISFQDREWLRQMVLYLMRVSEVGVVVPKRQQFGGRQTSPIAYKINYSPANLRIKSIDKLYDYQEGHMEYDAVSIEGALIARDTFTVINELETSIHQPTFSDALSIDTGLRLQAHGLKAHIIPDASVVHNGDNPDYDSNNIAAINQIWGGLLRLV